MLQNETNARFHNSFEDITKGINIINSDHKAIHDGIGALVSSDLITLTSGSTKSYCLTTPTALYPHFKNIMLKTLGGSCKLEVIRGATVTVNTGTALLITNPNDNSSTTPGMTVKETPTYTGGTVWKKLVALADATNQTTGIAEASENDNQELVMKTESEEYILLITNLTTDTIKVAWDAFWYEEEKGLS